MIGGDPGYLIAMLVGSFLAQCINFPLQRNITFRSKETHSIRQYGILLPGSYNFRKLCIIKSLDRNQSIQAFLF